MFLNKFSFLVLVFVVIEKILCESYWNCDSALQVYEDEISRGKQQILLLQKQQYDMTNLYHNNENRLRSELEYCRENCELNLNFKESCKLYEDQIKNLEIALKIQEENCVEKMKNSQNFLRVYTTNHCDNIKKIYNRDGKYLKSICDVHQGKNYRQAKEFCTSHGMDLLIIENEEVFNGLVNFMAVKYDSRTPKVWSSAHGIWINGHRDGSNWVVSKNEKISEMPSGIKFKEETSHAGDCFVLKNNKGYEGRNYQCSKSYWFLCEFASVF